MIWLLPPPTPPPTRPVSSTGDTQEDRKRDFLLTVEGVGFRGGAKSYDGKKAWSSITHSILSA